MASDREMLERIAKLSSAIERQKSIVNSRGGFGRGRGSYYPPPSYRGRGGNMSLSHRSIPPRMPSVYKTNKYINPSLSNVPQNSHHKTLVSNNIQQPSATINPQSRHKQLIINNKGNTTIGNTVVKSVDAATGRKQVAIDGVDFVVKGRKLIRKDLFDSNTLKTNVINNNINAPKVLIRKSIKSTKRRDKNKNMVIGTAPLVKRKKTIHRSNGNMVFVREPEGYVRQGRSGKSLILHSRKRTVKKPRYCGFYTRFGVCPKATRCPFLHDPKRRAICPKFLQNRCRKKDGECKLSHSPNPHIMPHCVHFQKNRCTNDACQYIHVKVSKDAPVCRAFSMEGYCPKGLSCTEKHVHVCPEFAETGKCSNANCRLPHVARRHASETNNGVAGVARLGSWFSSEYFHAQKVAKADKLKSAKEAASSKVWTRPMPESESPALLEEKPKEKEEQDGFIRLFEDSDDDDGWSQYERSSDIGNEEIKSLRFNEDEEEEEEEEEEESDVELEQEKSNRGDEQDESDNSSEDEFYDAVDADNDMEDASNNGEDSDVEEVYEVVSDDNMEE